MKYSDIKTVFRIVNPWKIKVAHEGDHFAIGWNECLKELKKKQKKFIDSLYDIGDLC